MKSLVLICKCDIEGAPKPSQYWPGLTGPWCNDVNDVLNNPRYISDASLNKNQTYYCFDDDGKTIKICGENYYYRVYKKQLYDFFYTELEVRKLKIEKLNNIK